MALPIRNSVKVLLLNSDNELLLMKFHDPSTKSIDGTYKGHFWAPIGGMIEPNESLLEAAIREVQEETCIAKDAVEFGPPVWYGEFDLVLFGTPTHLKQTFIVAKTKQKDFSLSNLTEQEKAVVKNLAWFSCEKIKNSDEIIYPVIMAELLPDIVAGNYPEKVLVIDLAKLPKK